MDQAVAMADKIGSMSLPVALMAKEATNAAYEGTLAEGCRLERRMFHSCFALVSFTNYYCTPQHEHTCLSNRRNLLFFFYC